MLPSLYVVILNWNLARDTGACIESVLDAGAQPGQLIVVDNGSTDGSPQEIAARFANVQLVRSETNLGFAGGMNLGIRRAMDNGAEWMLLLNNDTCVDARFFSELEHAWRLDEQLGVIAPLILYYDDPQRIWYLGDRLLPGLPLSRGIFRETYDRGKFPPLLSVDLVSGCGMLVRRTVFERVGLFDTRFFMYGEDADWSWRAHSAGVRMACSTRARMWHKVSVSASRDRPGSRYVRTRNQIRVYRLHSPGWQTPLVCIFTAVRSLGMAARDLLRGDTALIGPLILGWLEGWLGSMDSFQDA
jgi:GT2 family glycosyltransferase